MPDGATSVPGHVLPKPDGPRGAGDADGDGTPPRGVAEQQDGRVRGVQSAAEIHFPLGDARPLFDFRAEVAGPLDDDVSVKDQKSFVR